MQHKLIPAGILLVALAPALALGQGSSPKPAHAASTGAAPSTGKGGSSVHEANQAGEHLNKALQQVQQMEKDADLKKSMAQARGVFLVPDYGRAALGIGGQGGAGILLTHEKGKWTGPGFYNFGGISVGLQGGASAGQIAMLLMSDKAIKSFAQNNKFSLNADAGLTIVNWSNRAHASGGHGDVLMWSDTEGLFGNASISVTDVNFDENETKALYGKKVSAAQVAQGMVTSPKAASLLHALP